MKKTTKKLQLGRETVRRLADSRLNGVVGGGGTYMNGCSTVCDPTEGSCQPVPSNGVCRSIGEFSCICQSF